MENEIIKERFLGTIFGQAVGDALGLSTEFMSKQEVDRFYPNGIEDYSQIVQDDHRRRWQRGDWTDDTDMMLSSLKIVLSGGDADTNAAVAGAILGAKFGICHIPEEWKDGLL